jgi:hypothetical protein
MLVDVQRPIFLHPISLQNALGEGVLPHTGRELCELWTLRASPAICTAPRESFFAPNSYVNAAPQHARAQM